MNFISFIMKNKIVFLIIIMFIMHLISPIERMSQSKYKGKKVILYNFNTSWCYYSKILMPAWKKLEKHYKNNKYVKVIDIKCDEKQNKKICKKFKIRSYPTIIKVKDGKKIIYKGNSTVKALIEFIES